MTITIDGEVGPDAAQLLDQATRAALETEGVHRVAVDLRTVEHWTTDGFRALTRCAARHPDVRFRFGAGVTPEAGGGPRMSAQTSSSAGR